MMQLFDPTVLIALDPATSRFSVAVGDRLQKTAPALQSLVQIRSIVEQKAGLTILDPWEGNSQNYPQNQNAPQQDSLEKHPFDRNLLTNQLKQKFTQSTQHLQTELTTLLQLGRSQSAIQTAREQGIEAGHRQRVYLLLSGSSPVASTLLPDVVPLLRFLFQRTFKANILSLEAIVLLPGLLSETKSESYAATYALLKEIETLQADRARLAFEGIWLLDSCNAKGVQLSPLVEEPDSYCDALIAFLSTSSESAVVMSDRQVKGKVSAYSTFGYSELIYPAQQVVDRLSRTLAINILKTAFLAIEPTEEEYHRRLLLETKAFAVGDASEQILQILEQPDGRRIWRDFNPTQEFKFSLIKAYIEELRHGQQVFRSKELLSYKKELEEASNQTKEKLLNCLDQKIENQLDSSANGLQKTIDLLSLLTAPAIALQAVKLGEPPENLVTIQRQLAAMLDLQLNVRSSAKKSNQILEQIQNLHRELEALEAVPTDLRSTETVVLNAASSETAALPNPSTADQQTEQEKPLNLPPPKTVADRILEIHQQIAAASAQYRVTIEAEEQQAKQQRVRAITQQQSDLEQEITKAEKKLLELGESLEKTKEKLDDALEARQNFIVRFLILYTAIPVLIWVLISGISITTGLWSSSAKTLSGIAVFGIIAWIISFIRGLSGINQAIEGAKKQYLTVQNSLRTAAVNLKRTHSDRLKFDYEIYLQRIRETTYDALIQKAKQKATMLFEICRQLKDYCEDLSRQREQILLPQSITRTSILSLTDVDRYYQSNDPESWITTFSSKTIRRSHLCQISFSNFTAKLNEYSFQQFKQLMQLSIGDLLSGKSEVIQQHGAAHWLQRLCEQAEPMLQLYQVDNSLTQVGIKDTALSLYEGDRASLLEEYRRLNTDNSIQTTQNPFHLRMFTRCLGFPAHFISTIDLYRDCYQRSNQIELNNRNLPDLMPTDQIQAAWRNLLLAIALRLIRKDGSQGYIYQNHQLGSNREKIAEQWTFDFSSQAIYEQICEHLEQVESKTAADVVYRNLQEMQANLEQTYPAEKELLNEVLQAYNSLS